MRFFFRKKEKLTSEKEIDLLFTSGKSSFIYPIKIIFSLSKGEPQQAKVLVTVSKRYLKNAADRNQIKRRLRESYRLNALNLKSILAEKNMSISIAFIYTSSKIITYEKLEAIMKKHLTNIVTIIEKSENNT